jgi:ABC-type Fe3+ transport system permease subunit
MSAPAPAREIDDQLTNDAELELRHGAPFVQQPSWTAKLVALCAIGAIGLVVVAPIVFMLTQSFNRAGLGKPFVFGLDAWQTMLDSERTLKSLGYTLLLSLRVPIAVVLGAGIAWFLARTEIRLKRWVEYSLWLAFFMPTLPIVLGWIVLADPRTGLVNNTLSYLPGGISLNIFSLQGIFWIHIMLTTVPVRTSRWRSPRKCLVRGRSRHFDTSRCRWSKLRC